MTAELRSQKSEVRRIASRDSFTLIELMLVMLITIILAGGVVGSISYINRKAAEAKSHAILAKIAGALEAYNADWGMYPLADSNFWYGVAAIRGDAYTNFNCFLLTNLAGTGPGMKRYITWASDETNNAVLGGTPALYIVDGFGTPIAYDPNSKSTNIAMKGQFPLGRVNFRGYDLWSFGADMKSFDVNTMRDDLKNWE